MLRRLVLATATVVLALAALLGPTSPPAGAWGERDAARPCGTNLIESWYGSTTYTSNTVRRTGTCNSTLYSYVRNGSGLYGGSGSTSGAWLTISKSTWPSSIGGAHKGCPSCGLSYT